MQLKNAWASGELPSNSKIRLLNSNAKAVLYKAESWKTIVTTTKKIQTFINTCLKNVSQACWPEIIKNEKLWLRTKQKPAAVEARQRR